MTHNEVAGTARTTAAIRARETSLPDALFRDPFAEALAGPSAMAALRSMPEEMQQRFSTFTVVRTRIFDDWLMSVTSTGGIRQVVMLGAGLDSRAFRLNWPPGVTLWELDQPSVLAAKASELRDIGASPRCERNTLAVDLAGESWPGELTDAGWRRELPTAWLIEGLLPYMAPGEAFALLDAVSASTAAGSQLAADMVDRDSVAARNAYLAHLRKATPSTQGAPFQFGTDDPELVLRERGWANVQVLPAADAAARFGRALAAPAAGSLLQPRLWLVTAQRRMQGATDAAL